MKSRTPAPAHRTDDVSGSSFDGIVCFGGEDWWYHNRGHFDIQMMRELSHDAPVLYINSIGMRFPRLREGEVFLQRLHRKWNSMRRGIVRVRANFSVYSPVAVPGRFGRLITLPGLRAQTRWAIGRMGMRSPLVWVNNPVAWSVITGLQRSALVYQRTDRYEEFPDVDRERIAAFDRSLKRAADLTVFCASPLFDAEGRDCRRAEYVDHGVDFESFVRGSSEREPEDLRSVPRPRVGFIGGIDRQTFDPELFHSVVELLPDFHFVLVGGCTLPGPWMDGPNVHHLGRKDYEDVWRYPGSCDVLIMPWNRSRWIEACNPVKLKEYLAAGRPVVSTWFEELRHYAGYVRVADEPETFARAIREELASDSAEKIEQRRERVRSESWRSKADLVRRSLAEALGGGSPAEAVASR